MPLNRNALMRMRTIDACLRRRQRLWTIEDLQEACEDALYEYEGISEISTRTIRRDLQLMRSDKLGYNAPIIVVDKKYYTYEDPDYSITQLPLSKEDLAELSSAMDIIKHYGGFQSMAGQEDILARMQDRIRTQSEHRQVVFIETNQMLKGLHYLGRLYDHIIKKEVIEVTYRSFTAKSVGVYHVSPYLLKEYNNRWWLIGYGHKLNRVLTIALDRIIDVARWRLQPFVENTFFDPEAYFAEMVGVTRNLNDRTEKVILKVDGAQAPYVTTKPLHSSQQIVETADDGTITIALQLIPNWELERIILGFGNHIEVLSPSTLRQNIAAATKAAAARYDD